MPGWSVPNSRGGWAGAGPCCGCRISGSPDLSSLLEMMGRCVLLSVGQLINSEPNHHRGGMTLLGSHPEIYPHLGVFQPSGPW